ncbi:MAG: thiamine-binding protein [Acidobacteriota bacterium]|nr:thiamine-binding protein [Acidobacteriota bacterium]
MAVLAAFSVAPAAGPALAEDGSVGATVAEVVRIVRDSGLPYETNAMFTNVEGSLDEVLDLVKRCTEHVASVSPRVSVVVKLDVREGHPDALHGKVATVERLLGGPRPD